MLGMTEGGTLYRTSLPPGGEGAPKGRMRGVNEIEKSPHPSQAFLFPTRGKAKYGRNPPQAGEVFVGGSKRMVGLAAQLLRGASELFFDCEIELAKRAVSRVIGDGFDLFIRCL